jgi:diacylglycerol kinase (ATP)
MRYFLNRLKYRIIWSWSGCRDAWINEHSFRSGVWANLVSAGFALLLPVGNRRARTDPDEEASNAN